MNKKTLAIDGGTPFIRRTGNYWPQYGEEEKLQLMEVLESGQWGCLTGNKVHDFEKAFSRFQQAEYGICVPNGTLALEMALKALEIGPGDEVITTPYTFIATVSSILLAGAKPVFVDIDQETYLMDLEQLESAVTDRTRAVVPVHLGGRPVNMDKLNGIAEKHSLRILEDACQAWGSEWNGKRVGALGDLGTFSFQSSKNITAGEGGIVITNDKELAERCWSLHNVGRVHGGQWYQHERIGWNLRMTEWQGAVLLAQLQKYPAALELRKANRDFLYQLLISEVAGLTPLSPDPGITSDSCHLFIMRYNPDMFGARSRDEFLTALVAEGVDTAASGYVPLHQSPAVKKALADLPGGIPDQRLPKVEKAAEEAIWLGQTEFLGDKSDMEALTGAIKKIQRAWT